MFVNKLVVRIILVISGLAIAGPSLAHAPATSTPTTSGSTCSILLGGGGMVFPSDDQNQKWFMVNRVVSQAVASTLQSMGYRIYPLIVDVRDTEDRLKLLGAAVARDKCSRVVQITHALSGQSQTTPGVAKNFEFDVSVLALSTDGKLTGLFQKTYRYPLTREVMQSLSMSAVGKAIATDVDHAHVIYKTAESVDSKDHGK